MAKTKTELKNELKQFQVELNALEAKGSAITAEELKQQEKIIGQIHRRATELKKINSAQLENKKLIINSISEQERGIKSIGSLYAPIQENEKIRVKSLRESGTEHKKNIASFEAMASINTQIAQLSKDDVIQAEALQLEFDKHLQSLDTRGKGYAEQVQYLTQSNQLAQNYARLSDEQKDQLESQLEVYKGIKKTISGIADTLSTLTSGPAGFLGTVLIGAGFAADKLGNNIRSFGGFIDSAQLSALGLGFIFDGAEETAKSLSKEFGGLKDVTLATQLNTNLMATNMGISGDEAAGIVGTFARLNDGSTETAMNMAATTKEMAKAAGVPVDQVMKDVAKNTEAFALYGKDGGVNMMKAAVAAGKVGVEMDALTRVTDNLLDFETSITKEMELGAMLGRNINLDRARGLAAQDNMTGAVKATLDELGGIEEFNKMDRWSKKATLDLLGLSAEEFQKMAANSDKLNEDGTVQVSTFDAITEAITASATASGGFLKTMGGLVLGAAQMGGSFAQMGMDVKGMASAGLDKIKGFFGAGKPAVPTTPATPPSPTTMAPQAQAGPADQANKMSKIKSGDLIKGAVALLILAAALFVAAKAFQEFAEVTWESVGMGLVALAGLAGIAFLLSKIQGEMIKGAVAVAILGAALIPFAFALNLMSNVDANGLIASGIALIAFTGAVFALGALLAGPGAIIFGAGIIGFLALGAALIVLGAGLQMVGAGFSAISSGLPMLVEQISALSTINFLPILGLAGALTILSIALAAVAATGMLALPALLALGLVAGGAASMMGGGEGEGGDRTGELIDEIKGLRNDLLSGKIGVNIDGQKVTAKVSAAVDKISSNSYAKV
jgi:hypothetical protein